MFLYRSREAGLEKAPLCATSRPAITCFTATSTFLPLMVYCGREGEQRASVRRYDQVGVGPPLAILFVVD